MTIEGKVVVVTGVSSGIGRAIAEVFTSRGALVVGAARRRQLGEELERSLDGQGTFSFACADLTSPDECGRVFEATLDRHGRVDVLINNAGGVGSPAVVPTEDASPDHWHSVLAMNLDSTFYCSQHFVRHAKARGDGGVILNVASTQAVECVAGMAAYNAAKAAVVQLSRTLAVEYLSDRIRVNAVLMGGAATAASRSVFLEMRGEAGGTSDVPEYPRLPRPLHAMRLVDIAGGFAALAGDDAALITGATIAMDRAMSAGSLFSESIAHAHEGGWNLQGAGSS